MPGLAKPHRTTPGLTRPDQTSSCLTLLMTVCAFGSKAAVLRTPITQTDLRASSSKPLINPGGIDKSVFNVDVYDGGPLPKDGTHP